MILDVALFKHHGIDPAAAFLHGVCEKHDCSDTCFWPIPSAIGLPVLDYG
jgi:hypothetical protein